MFTNLLISVISATLVLAAAYLVVKPVLRKKFFNTPGVVEQIWVDEQTSVLMLTRPFPWFVENGDFLDYVLDRRNSDSTIDILCYLDSQWKDPTMIFASCTSVRDGCRYDFQKLGLKCCKTAAQDTAVVRGHLSREEIKKLVLMARR